MKTYHKLRQSQQIRTFTDCSLGGSQDTMWGGYVAALCSPFIKKNINWTESKKNARKCNVLSRLKASKYVSNISKENDFFFQNIFFRLLFWISNPALLKAAARNQSASN